jgi:NAD(P)H dehydrogenase (quinone)
MITVTAATGHLGRLVVEHLLDRGVPAAEIVAAVRNPAKAADLATRGVQVREADYSRPETLGAALAGTDKLLLISSSEVGRRVAQHQNVIDAAVAAGVGLIAYTSILQVETSDAPLVPEHKATEELIRASGLPFVFLRNGWYLENYTENLAPALAQGAFAGSAGDGKISAATRSDFAAAAAAVLTGDDHAGKAYELGGDAFTMSELAAEVAAQTGKPIGYQDLPAEQYTQILVGAGLPEAFAQVLAGSDVAITRGELFTTSTDLPDLIGRPTTPLADAVALGLKAS